MTNYYWNDLYSGWGWLLWFGILFLFFSSIGNWGYTYRAHRKMHDGGSQKDALAILNERLARGDIAEPEYLRLKTHIMPQSNKPLNGKTAENSFGSHPPMGSPIHSNM